jgi:hypothetical protein
MCSVYHTGHCDFNICLLELNFLCRGFNFFRFLMDSIIFFTAKKVRCCSCLQCPAVPSLILLIICPLHYSLNFKGIFLPNKIYLEIISKARAMLCNTGRLLISTGQSLMAAGVAQDVIGRKVVLLFYHTNTGRFILLPL